MKKNVKLLILSLIASLAFTSAFAACNMGDNSSDTGSNSNSVSDSGSSDNSGDSGSGDVGGDETSDVVITLSETENVMKFESKQLSPLVSGAEEGAVITWTSSNESVATVDGNGLVSALSVGTATITASIGSVSASCVVTVEETTFLHEIELSLEEVSMYVEKSQSVSAGVTFKGEEIVGDFEYTWELIDGENDVVVCTQDGDTATFVGLKPGTVTYVVYTNARGYEASKEITVTVKETTYALGITHDKVLPSIGGYSVDLTLGSDETSVVEGVSAYLVVNGEAKADQAVNVTWSTDSDYATFEGGTITANTVGTTVLTGSATYNNKEAKVVVTVNVKKGEVALDDTMDIEVVSTESITIPDSVNKGTIQSVKLGDKVLYAANEYGSLNGNVLTVAKADLPVKDKDLGKDKTLTIETDLVIYTMNVNVYTMIINSAEELDEWQEVAAQNAIDAGLVIEAQRGLVYSGYFVLGGNINYNTVWTPYKKYGDLWALCYNNTDIWVDGVKDGTLVEGAIQEDWGAGNNAGFKGTFDGNGYYINGMQTSGDYSGFVVTMGGGTIKNVAFTNAKIDTAASLVINRGNGTLENVYVSLASIANGKSASHMTAVLGVSGNAPMRTLNNIIIDASRVDLSNWQYGYLAEISGANANGVYVLGAEELVFTKTNWDTASGSVFWHHNNENDVAGVFNNSALLMADPTHGAIVQEWTGMWTLGAGYALPESVIDMLSGDFAIVSEQTKIPGGTSLAITSDKAPAYVTYALKEEVKGVSIEGNVISVAVDATVGVEFTVVATSLIDGMTAEMTFKTDYPIVVLEDEMADVEFVKTETITLPDSIEGTVSKVVIGSCVLYDAENGIGSLNSNVITPASLPVKAADLGKGVTMAVSTDVATYHLSVNVYTMIINDKAELDKWQEVAADNSVKAGVVIEEQKLAYLTGYFILGDNIEYNDTWTPIISHVGTTPSIYSLCNYGNTNVKGWQEQYGVDKVIAVNGWTDPTKLGFHGTFDGDGHYINGMRTQGEFSGFNVVSGTNAVYKDIAFTNAEIGEKAGFLFNRGSGAIENVYVEVVAMESGAGDSMTTVFGLTGYSASSVKNVIIDASKVDFTDLSAVYLADLGSAKAGGIYVIANGLEESTKTSGGKAAFWDKSTDEKDPEDAAVFATVADLLASGKVNDWTDMWTVNENFVLPTSVYQTLIGEFEIIAEQTEIPANSSLALTTNKASAYMTYALKEEVVGVSIVGNVVTISLDATVGSTFTVVATNAIDGTTAEIELTVAKGIIALESTMEDIEFVKTETIALPEEVEGTVSKVTIGSFVLYDVENGIGSINGNVITPASLPVKDEDLGKGKEVTIVTDFATYTTSANVYTMIIDNKAELDQWQAVAADNSVKAGLCVEEQKKAVLSGYFILGDNIEYNNTWSPILTYAGVTPSIYSTISQASTLTDLRTKYADDADALEKIIEEEWGKGIKAGFKGTFDGNGHYINGLITAGEYSSFIVVLGGGTIKNVAFTNASIGAGSSLVADRGNGTLENVYVGVYSLANGPESGKSTHVLMRNGYQAVRTIKNVIVDVSKVDVANWKYGYISDAACASLKGVYVVGAPAGFLNTQTEWNTSNPVGSSFWHHNPNTASSNYDIGATFASAADLLADETHGAIVKAWAGDFWTVDEANGKVLPTVLTEKMPVYVESLIIPTTTGQNNMSIYDGDVTELGFAEGTTVYAAEITDGWNSRIAIVANKTGADYISVDFALAEGTTVNSFTLWPTGFVGNYAINGNGAYATGDNGVADQRMIVIYDQNGNDVTCGPWVANTVYTLRYYLVGETTENDKLAFSTFNTNNTIYFGEIKCVNDDSIPLVSAQTNAPVSTYQDDVTALGFAEGTKVYQQTYAAAWNDRVKMVVTDLSADYIKFDFVVTEGEISRFYLWDNNGKTGSGGNYNIDTDKVSANVTSERKIVIYDENGNNIYEQTGLAQTFEVGKVYTAKVYIKDLTGANIRDNFAFAPVQAGTVCFANITCGFDA